MPSPGHDPSGIHLPGAIATRDDAIRAQEEVTVLLLQQMQDLHAAEQYLAAYYVELGSSARRSFRPSRSGRFRGANIVRIQSLRDQTAHQLGEIQDFERRLEHMTRERDRLQAINGHLAADVNLTGAEILDLQTEHIDVERGLEDSEDNRCILEGSLDRVQAELRWAEPKRPQVQDLVARPQSPDPLAQERDRALASTAEAEARVAHIRSELESRQQGHVDIVAWLSRLRAVHNATLSSEETVDALGQRVREIQDQPQAAKQDREDLRLRYQAACRERGTAYRQLSIVASVVGAHSRTRPEEEDPAALLRLLREEPADTSEHPTPRYLSYEDPLGFPPKDVDPHNLPDPVTSTAPKHPRGDSATPDPNSTPPAKRRPAFRDPADLGGGRSLPDPANRGGEIDDDGGQISENHEEDGDLASDEATTSRGLDPAPRGGCRDC
ncbi:unnamed protein product [Phytophthora fragariaefolia]|uniref:Unnamed protein product n=1 Tax=Phytophthora fragariaefolia TaxID=1490495 RepID=A0A9W6XZ30_9STRA|nr:unnamed protein product [Phytophthora fragariaefolia]